MKVRAKLATFPLSDRASLAHRDEGERRRAGRGRRQSGLDRSVSYEGNLALHNEFRLRPPESQPAPLNEGVAWELLISIFWI